MHVGEWVCVGTPHQDGMSREALCVLTPGSCVSGLSPEARRSPGWVGLLSGLCHDVLAEGGVQHKP